MTARPEDRRSTLATAFFAAVVGLGAVAVAPGSVAALPLTTTVSPADRPGAAPVPVDPFGAAPASVDPFGGAPAPAAAPAAVLVSGPGPAFPPVVQPSVQYEEALAHAHDPNRFTPGSRVAVGYTPEAGDGWPVGGVAPAALPAGNATGQAMAQAVQGSSWAVDPPPDLGSPAAPGAVAGPVDGPSVPTIAATSTSAVIPLVSAQPNLGSASKLHREVFGFLPYWTLGDRTTVLNDSLLTTIAYFSVGADANGNLLKRNPDGSISTGWGGWTSSAMSTVITNAHAQGTRVVLTLSVFAWTTGSAALQGALLGGAAARRNLARQAVAAVRDRGADGINLDFEPIAAGHAADFTALVRTIRAELDRVHRGYQLTFDATGWIGNYPIEAATAPGGADAIFIMGYDYRGDSAPTAGSIDPLAGSGYTLTDTIRAYTARVSPSKLILGLPYYGRAWSTTTSALRAPNQSGSRYGTSNPVLYGDATRLAAVYGRRYDSKEQVAWFAYKLRTCSTAGCVMSWRQVYFDDAQALKARYDLVIQSDLRGAGIWALGYDATRSELYGAISLKFLHDTTPPQSGISILPATTVDAGFVVSWQAVDDSGIRSYDVEVTADGGLWTPWVSNAHATSAVFAGATGHSYSFRARATDVYGNVGPWDVTSTYDPTPSLAIGGFGKVLVDGIAARSDPDTSAMQVATLAAGSILAILGGPIGADGYTWYQVTGPLATWNPVTFTQSGIWVAVRSASASFVAAAPAPNSTLVVAGMDGFTVGAAAPVGRLFSPNGDGVRDTVRVAWTNHRAFDSMTLRVLRPDGTLVGVRPLADVGAGRQAYDWDGRVEGTGDVPDGTYMLQLQAVAGSVTCSAPSARPTTPAQLGLYAATIDRVPPTLVTSSASGSRISPIGHGRFDRLTFAATAKGGVTWSFTVAPASGSTPTGGSTPPAAVRTLSGTGTKATVSWNGHADDGSVVPDGTYRVALAIADLAGNAVVRAWTVVVDGTAPTIVATLTPSSISPDGDGATDSTVIRWTSDEPLTGLVSIRSAGGIVRSWPIAIAATHGAVRWNGVGRFGRLVADGTYVARVEGTDGTGNRTVVDVRLVVDRTAGFLHWSRPTFTPQSRDRALATVRVTVNLTRTASVTLAILDPSGAVVRTVWAARTFAAGSIGWTWDGRTGAGAWAAAGTYVAVLTATSARGTTTLQRSIFLAAR